MAQAPGPWYRIVRKGRPAGPVAHRKSPDTSRAQALFVELAGLTLIPATRMHPPEDELHGPLPPCRAAPSEAVTTRRVPLASLSNTGLPGSSYSACPDHLSGQLGMRCPWVPSGPTSGAPGCD